MLELMIHQAIVFLYSFHKESQQQSFTPEPDVDAYILFSNGVGYRPLFVYHIPIRIRNNAVMYMHKALQMIPQTPEALTDLPVMKYKASRLLRSSESEYFLIGYFGRQ